MSEITIDLKDSAPIRQVNKSSTKEFNRTAKVSDGEISLVAKYRITYYGPGEYIGVDLVNLIANGDDFNYLYKGEQIETINKLINTSNEERTSRAKALLDLIKQNRK